VSCPVCISKQIELMRSYNAVNAIFDGVNLYKCQNCELVYAFPLPKPVDIEKYNNNYFSSAHGVSVDSFFAKSFFEGIAQIRIKYISDKSGLNFANVSSILEVGPGRGYLAKELLKLNTKMKYDAIETDSSCHQQLESIGVRLTKSNQLGVYDLIIISHVLEHTEFPYNFLAKYFSLLKPGGIIFLEVPCSDWLHKSMDEPHLLFFNKKSMNALLKRFHATVVDIGYYGELI
jgi:SAM-dependent methyltransferase